MLQKNSLNWTGHTRQAAAKSYEAHCSVVVAADLPKLEHLDLHSLLLQLSQLLLSGGLVLHQLHMLMTQLALSRLQLCPLICQLLQHAALL